MTSRRKVVATPDLVNVRAALHPLRPRTSLPLGNGGECEAFSRGTKFLPTHPSFRSFVAGEEMFLAQRSGSAHLVNVFWVMSSAGKRVSKRSSSRVTS